jgi:DNA-binding MarR family transcriptional regulator
MNNKQAKELAALVADLQTELNKADRIGAATLQVGSAEDLQVLRLLLARGSLRVGEIASCRSSSVATVSARLDRLERRGLVIRERPPGDRRAVVSSVTKVGAETAQASKREREKVLRRLDADISMDTVEALVNAFREQAELDAAR